MIVFQVCEKERNFQENPEGCKFNGMHQLLAYADMIRVIYLTGTQHESQEDYLLNAFKILQDLGILFKSPQK
jgi:hypothetical protein